MKCKKLNIINVLMKSLIHIIMDITKYRQHVVNSPYVTNHLNGEPWEEVRMFVPPHLRLRQRDKLIGAYKPSIGKFTSSILVKQDNFMSWLSIKE